MYETKILLWYITNPPECSFPYLFSLHPFQNIIIFLVNNPFCGAMFTVTEVLQKYGIIMIEAASSVTAHQSTMQIATTHKTNVIIISTACQPNQFVVECARLTRLVLTYCQDASILSTALQIVMCFLECANSRNSRTRDYRKKLFVFENPSISAQLTFLRISPLTPAPAQPWQLLSHAA